MRRTFIFAIVALLGLAAPAAAQRGIADNPYPHTLHTPSPAPTTKAARAKFRADSLKAEYPVSSKGEACWRFSDPESIHTGDGYFCYRDRGNVLDSLLALGNFSTYHRGAFKNEAQSGRAGTLVMTDGSRVRVDIQ
jgi:hypothetical protein